MRKLLVPIFLVTGFLCNAQLSVKNDAYVYVKDEVLFVKDDINLTDSNSKIYLREEAQLIQGDGVTGNSGLGELSVYQNGTVNHWIYNYWCSPVGNNNLDNTLNIPFQINQIDDPLLSTPDTIDSANSVFTNDFEGLSSPLTIARRWLWTYVASDSYADWVYAGENNDILPGLGFTMKGMGSGSTGNQTYDFRGKPNNGTITNIVLEDLFTLVGNPYPSAIDAKLFINDPDNVGAIDGTLYYWEQDADIESHNLTEYLGGYAEYTIDNAGVETFTPTQFATYDNSGNVVNIPPSPPGFSKIAKRYIPIGQGFMVKGEVSTTGLVYAKNEHRVYVKEGADSYFFRNANTNKNSSNTVLPLYQDNGLSIVPDDYKRFRINVDFATNGNFYSRQIVVNFNDTATHGFDYGLELRRADINSTDVYFSVDNIAYSGVAYPFDINLSIPLTLDIAADQPLKFRIFDIQNFDITQAIYLHDTETNTYVDLRLQDFEINIPSGHYAERFEIVFTPQSILGTETFEIDSLKVFQDNINQQLTIFNPSNIDVTTIDLYDISGKKIFTNHYSTVKNQYVLSTTNLSSGTYIANIISTTQHSKSEKIIIKN